MPTVASTLYENIHSLHMEQSPVDQCPLLYNFLLIPCYLTLIGPATISLSHLMLSLTGLRSPPRSQLKGSCWSQTGACWLGILKTSSEENSPQAPWEGTLPSAPDTNAVVKLKGIEPWVHTSRLGKVPPDIWSCADAGDPWTKSIRERSTWLQDRQRWWIKTSYFNWMWNNCSSLSFPLALAWKDNTLICISQAIFKGSNLSDCSICYQRF